MSAAAATTSAAKNIDMFLAHRQTPVCALQVRSHVESLTHRQRMYALHMAQASWHGTRIVLQQVSAESPPIYDLIMALATDSAAMAHRDWMEYCAQFLGNLGNYRSFGDTKFVPRVPVEGLDALVAGSGSASAAKHYAQCREAMYALQPESVRMLGYPGTGKACSAYYSYNITQVEIEAVQGFLERTRRLNAYNTRLFKDDADGSFTVRIASAELSPAEVHQHEGHTIKIVWGDYAETMARIVKSIEAAMPFCENEIQRQMLEKYALSFRTGSIEAHKDSQRFWIRDVGPVVESNIGFIESYRDPAGVRAEWEGFVAVVNKEQTRKFEQLVSSAPNFIEKLPWGAAFEKDRFQKPDFTSLEIIAFCTSGIPAGINIPNYDDIRQVDGFKNVSLGNILNAQAPSEEITFLTPADKELFSKYRAASFEVQVGIHELLGHGSGKLLEEAADGTVNFDRKSPPVSPVTGQPIKSWYKSGETYSSKFGNFASSYEECRAEACGIFLSLDTDIIKIFGHQGKEARDVVYVNWLLMVRAGLLALEFYDPATNNWGQAHMRARYAILRVLLQAGGGLVKLDTNSDVSDATIQIDESLVHTVGKSAIGDFLKELQVYKATADVEAASKLYGEMTAVPDEWLPLRDLVIKKRQPRKVFCQPNLRLVDGGERVDLVEYEASAAGLVKSFYERGL